MHIPVNINDLIINSIAEGIIVVNKSFNIVKANERAHEMFAFAPKELIGLSISNLIPSKFHQNHIGHQDRFLKDPSKRSMGLGMDLKGVKKNGVEFPVEISLNHFTHEGEIFVLALISDITQKAQIQERIKTLNMELEKKVDERTQELKASEELYKSIAENFPNGSIILLDKDFKPLFRKGNGIDENHISDLKSIFPENHQLLIEQIESYNEKEVFSMEFQESDRFKEVKVLSLTQDKIQRYLIVEEDVTERKEAEHTLKHNIQKEKEVNEIKSRFLTMASHEFRTPLATVLSSTQLINKYIDKGDVEKITKHTARIGSSVNHLTEILNDFLSLDKIESGKVKVAKKNINIMELCTDVIEDIQILAKDGQFIEYAFAGKDPMIESDAKILTHIMINLLGNAIKYSKENGVIQLKTKIDEGEKERHLNITVTDNGIGIPPEDIKNLFTRFYRAKNVENISGTGLGLNIVKNYVHLLNGEINVTSEVDKGTTFHIKLPL